MTFHSGTMEYQFHLGPATLTVGVEIPTEIRNEMAYQWGRKVAWSIGVPR